MTLRSLMASLATSPKTMQKEGRAAPAMVAPNRRTTRGSQKGFPHRARRGTPRRAPADAFFVSAPAGGRHWSCHAGDARADRDPQVAAALPQAGIVVLTQMEPSGTVTRRSGLGRTSLSQSRG